MNVGMGMAMNGGVRVWRKAVGKGDHRVYLSKSVKESALVTALSV